MEAHEKEKVDCRQILYKRYVTSFKCTNMPAADPTKWFWKACKHVYLPLLNGLKRDNPILELGCGPGLFMDFLKKRKFSKIEGVDISEEQAQLAIQRGHNVHLGDAIEFLRTKRETFSAIFAIDFIEHFTLDEVFQLLGLVYSALSELGVLIIRTPNGEGLFSRGIIYGDLTHRTVFTQSSLSQLLQQFNFSDIEFYEFPPIPMGFRSRVRGEMWKLMKLIANFCRKVETGHTQKIWTENFVMRCVKHNE